MPFYVGGDGWKWYPDGKYDFLDMDKYFYRKLEIAPEARFSSSIGVDNYFNRNFNERLDAHPSELAGVAVINQNKLDCIYVSDNMFAVHTLKGGNRTFNVPQKFTKKATELFTGKEYEIVNGTFNAELEKMSTVLYLME